MNLGDHVGDLPAHVEGNRQLLQACVPAQVLYLKQIHGNRCVQLRADTEQGQEADAAWTSTPEKACAVLVADCLAVLLTDSRGSFVAAAHAGWRGLCGQQGRGVLEALLEQLRQADELPHLQQSAATHEIMAWLGPCIGPGKFEVGQEVKEAFVAHDEQAEQCFQSLGRGKYLAHLPQLARQRLQALGVTAIYGNDGSDAWCTYSRPERFYSYRRDQQALGATGRHAAVIWLDAQRRRESN